MKINQFSCGDGSVQIGSIMIDGRSVRIEGMGNSVQGSGNLITQIRPVVGTFDSLEIKGVAQVQVTRGPVCSIEVCAEDNLVDYMLTEVSGSTLVIGIKSGISIMSTKTMLVRVSMPQTVDVELTGSGSVSLSGLDQTDLCVKLSGSGDVAASGCVENLVLKLTGSGDIEMHKLLARTLNVKLSGSGNVHAYATDEAKVLLNGSGDMIISGNPKVRDSRVNGSGDVSFRG
ncbi:head GIN domain-containing protein [Hydrogenophaga defluvii]|uniref:Head GIN domain-containing protein n=1 Tax=Hydrogenophaga defluvii TaxID=249410 RepID=A0ABW2SCW6_9BURK